MAEQNTTEEQSTQSRSKRVRFSETVSVRQEKGPKRKKTTKTPKQDMNNLPEDDEIAYQAKQARRDKRKQLVEGFAEDDSDDDIALEAMGEADPTIDNNQDEFSHGVPLEAFNVREELDDGVIDPLSGVVNPRKSRDEAAKDEHWLVDFEEKMKDKRYAARFNQYKKNFSNMQADDDPGEYIDKNSILNEIANELLWGESVNSAMRRMRPQNSESKDKIKFNSFLERVDKAVSAGVSSIYSMTKEDILDFLDEADEKKSMWEYKWTNDPTVYGPMSRESMLEWLQQGYFVESAEYGPVLVRKVPSEDFVNITTVDFSQQ